MKSSQCVISVVTICFNCKSEIRKTIDSVLGQDYPQVDYIVIDGKSTDGTMDVVNKYSDRISTIVSEPDKGIYNAMNKGIERCQGDYVVFVNAGDIFASNNVLSQVVNQIKKAEFVPDLVYGTYMEANMGIVVPNRSYKKCWYGMIASHQSMFYRLGLLQENHIRYDETYRIAADYKLTLQVIHDGKNFLQIPTCIAKFDTNGISCSNPQLGMNEACRARKEVLHYSSLDNFFVLVLTKSAHLLKRYFGSLYKLLRYQ